MGRGLSDLQRWIVRAASERERLYYAEILVGYFGWQPVDKGWFTKDISKPGRQHFSKKAIGDKRYRKTMATLSRACTRLQERDLITCLVGVHARWSGVAITDKGREWLSVNTAEPVPEC